jgi:hypothetical protein
MLALTGSRVSQAMASYNRKMGLTPTVFRRSRAIIEKALRDGACLTRTELGEILRRERLRETTGTRLAHLMMQAELDAVVCSGPCRGKQFTYALLELRVPPVAAIDRDEALARLAGRYFATHGPATVHDFAWWSGLSMTDARRAVEIRGRALASIVVGDAKLWMTERQSPPAPATGTAHLLPNYDEFFIGHRDRSAIGRRLKGVQLVTGGDSSITHVAIVAGELVGGWRRTASSTGMTATLSLATRVTRDERARLERERARFAAFF